MLSNTINNDTKCHFMYIFAVQKLKVDENRTCFKGAGRGNGR